MKNLPTGNYAICMAHPGHELRLHGFLEQTKPYVFILTDGSHRTANEMMTDSILCIEKAIKKDIPEKSPEFIRKKIFIKLGSDDGKPTFIKDDQIYSEILNQYPDFLKSFIMMIYEKLIENKIDYLVSDPSEGYNVVHEVVYTMCDIASALVEKNTGKEIVRYDFAIEKPYNENLNDECVHIKLDDEELERKLNAFLNYQLALTDLKPNITLDYSLIIELSKMPNGKDQIKQLLKEINADFLSNEYLRPCVFNEPTEKTQYEILGQKAVDSEKYFDVITYENHLKPLKQKLESIILNNNAGN